MILDLVADADVLVEGMRPGVAERLGIGPDACLARNPRLVYGRMTGWGQDGPWSQAAGHDMNYIAITGTLHGLGQVKEKPQFPANLVGDFGGGSTYLVIGILAALLEAKVSGEGQVVDAAIVDGTAHLNTMLAAFLAAGTFKEDRVSNLLDGGAPFYDIYETADGEHMSVGALEPQFFAAFVELLGIKDQVPGQFELDRFDEMRDAHRRAVQGEDPRRVVRDLRRHRRLRRADPQVQRGRRPPAHEGARDPGREGRDRAAAAGAAVLAHRGDARDAARAQGRRPHPRRPHGLGHRERRRISSTARGRCAGREE